MSVATEHPPVLPEESTDGFEWRWDDRPANTGGQVYRIWHRYSFDPTDGYFNCVYYARRREDLI